MEELIEQLVGLPHAPSTVAKYDARNTHRLHNAMTRGLDEFFLWGLGPNLPAGSIVPLYVPDTVNLPKKYRMGISRIYQTASKAFQQDDGDGAMGGGAGFRHDVFLYKPVELPVPLPYAAFSKMPEFAGMQILNFGNAQSLWSDDTKRRFWSIVLDHAPDAEALVRTQFLDGQDNQTIAISYAGPDWVAARRMADWLRPTGASIFLITSTGELGDHEHAPLRDFLAETFRTATVSIILQPSAAFETEWTKVELGAALENQNYVYFLRRPDRKQDEVPLESRIFKPQRQVVWDIPEDSSGMPFFEKDLAGSVQSMLKIHRNARRTNR